MSAFDKILSRRTFTRSTVAASAGLAVGASAAPASLAQEATPVDEGGPAVPPPPAGSTVVAEGLVNPRFLRFGDDGTLYITENGVGGDEVLNQPPTSGAAEVEATPLASPEATPATGPNVNAPDTRGYTGQISMVLPDGTRSVIVDGLASYSAGIGPVGLALGPGELYFSIGGVAVGAGFEPLPEENTLNRYVLDTDTLEVIADLGSYEVQNNPDGADVNPNLYMVSYAADGRLNVCDAGGNVIYIVDQNTGEFGINTVVPPLGQLPGANPPAEMAGRQAVPTGVALAPDGATTYVGLLSEGWPEGAPSLLTLQTDGTFTPVAGPLSYNVGITVGPDGLVYASQLFTFSGTSPEPGPGTVVRITADGVIEPVIESVFMPHGLAFDANGNLYVAINSLASTPGSTVGQVIRMDGVAAV